ncbi:hypothetical protein BT63DRAFT_479563 [Microthyrium microscopicum]|uniref:AA9 family lytic polysaccharide monooxygenase n=1 Tax=Microthyrium microscopicum TaxID=703497 RepID=A0A6A6U964_9PEZI|nr:hypothetical protein BT63DRAFT_479563 [Microthyrium microscopicum]
MKYYSLIALLFAETVYSHATWNNFFVDGKASKECLRVVSTNSPTTNLASPDLRCGPGGAKPAASSCAVKAGSKIEMQMHQQPGDLSACPPKNNPAIGGRHFGPVMVYMCEVADAATSSGDCSWVKVAEDAYTGTESSWGTEVLNNNCGKRAYTIPKSLKSGNYLIRAEALALHSQPGQSYIACSQINVTGGGSTKLPAGVKFPGAYTATEVNKNIWVSNLKYTAPGPKVWAATA